MPAPRHAAFGATGKSFRRSPAGAGLLEEAWLRLGSRSRDDLLELVDEDCLPSGHPAGEQAAAEHAEIPARVIDLVGLLIASGDERLVQPDGAFRVGLRDPRGDRFELVDKGEGRVSGDVAAWAESFLHREFDGGAHRTTPLSRPARNAESSPRWK